MAAGPGWLASEGVARGRRRPARGRGKRRARSSDLHAGAFVGLIDRMTKAGPSTTASPCRALVVDDRDISRRGICSLLGSSRSIEVVGDVRSTDQVTEIVRTKDPTLVVMKLGSPTARYLQIVRWIKQHARRTKVLMIVDLAQPPERSAVLQAVICGVDGLLGADVSRQELLQAVNRVGNGEVYVQLHVLQTLFEQIRTLPLPLGYLAEPVSGRDSNLSARQVQIIHYIRLGLSNKEIAAELGLSEATVKTHVHRIFRKLGIADRTKAAVWTLTNVTALDETPASASAVADVAGPVALPSDATAPADDAESTEGGGRSVRPRRVVAAVGEQRLRADAEPGHPGVRWPAEPRRQVGECRG